MSDYTPDSPIIGPRRAYVTQARVVSAILSRRPTPTYTEWDFTKSIVPAYYEVCIQVQVDPLLAIAQTIHETGNFTSWWCQRPRRNPAGIGVTGHTQHSRPADITTWAYDAEKGLWRYGLSFPSWQVAVEVHVGRLVAYALKASQYTDAQRYYAQLALAYRPLPEQFHGVAPTLKGLNGRWAYPGFTYATRIASAANYLVRASM